MTYQKRITCGAAASAMASLVMASVGLLFSNPSTAADDSSVKRGQYLVQIGGCNDCHIGASVHLEQRHPALQ
jgi:hypothetical protein